MMIDENKVVESASESYDGSENISIGKKPRSRERGPDKKPRTYRANSMKNFVQFKERPEEFAKYLNEEKGINIAGNSGIVKAVLIFCVAMITIFGGLWLYNRYKNRKNNNSAETYQKGVYEQGIPATSFGVENIQTEFEKLKGLGVRFTMEPTKMDKVTVAVFDDTCGNLIQIMQQE